MKDIRQTIARISGHRNRECYVVLYYAVKVARRYHPQEPRMKTIIAETAVLMKYDKSSAALSRSLSRVNTDIWEYGDRQELHEKIRTLSMEAGRNVKEKGQENNLLELIAADPAFGLSLEDLKKSMDPSRYVGRAPRQVDEFLAEVVNPILDANRDVLGMKAEINV